MYIEIDTCVESRQQVLFTAPKRFKVKLRLIRRTDRKNDTVMSPYCQLF